MKIDTEKVFQFYLILHLEFLLISILACQTTFQGQSLKITAFQWPVTIFVIQKPTPKHFCFHMKMRLLAIEIISQGMMVKIPNNFFSTFYPKPPKKGSEVHFTCQSWLICKKFKFYIMPYICWPLCALAAFLVRDGFLVFLLFLLQQYLSFS